jgi:D-glycero-D-manno-heptose 1,7-bisphosphate phosphatase
MAYVILDRDGVINEDSDAYIKSSDEWRPIPGSLDAIALLTRHGYKVVVVTNQSGIARGLFTQATLDAIHDKMRRLTERAGGRIEDIFFCPHAPQDACSCRKPQTGLFLAFARKHAVELNGVPAVGDSLRDVEAALAVGAKPILVKTGKGARTLAKNAHLDIPIFADLHEAAHHLVDGR